ncbi:MAG: hypothetical protein G01um101418_648 [Parcubacteria group bacterium Gr01-1014_18]|nr:MAG: hypothetical protein Greene041636_641 [Parcubacteria group bacterium Greene0416_36]TSC80729.1 MAG: hypothetical protein G01um101418_648 [Parcubacteria group bacterium Gr01-1014_18]TSC98660.1 MAG: hypothetical protein Greene101420_619 [Parcubacteria group bacterium Greene1014_20]TSD07180.1 MAG: hypothetical protein Greene07142_349 [Parcubacteria group bacterium Greene0714_2]
MAKNGQKKKINWKEYFEKRQNSYLSDASREEFVKHLHSAASENKKIERTIITSITFDKEIYMNEAILIEYPYIHISVPDIVSLVTPKKTLDKELYERASSVKDNPLFPEDLINLRSSFKHDELRNAYTLSWKFGDAGEIQEPKFYPSQILSIGYIQPSPSAEAKDYPKNLEQIGLKLIDRRIKTFQLFKKEEKLPVAEKEGYKIFECYLRNSTMSWVEKELAIFANIQAGELFHQKGIAACFASPYGSPCETHYAPIMRPLDSYRDLINQRALLSIFTGLKKDFPYTPAQIAKINERIQTRYSAWKNLEKKNSNL